MGVAAVMSPLCQKGGAGEDDAAKVVLFMVAIALC